MIRKKQIPRFARKDNSLGLRRAVRRVVGLGFVAGRAGVEVGVVRSVRVRGRVGRGSRSWS